MQFAGNLGQIDAAADNLDVVIYGLLAVAFLLAVLTIWYWRHTKPRPVVVAPARPTATPAGGESSQSGAVASDLVPADDGSVLKRALGDDYDPDSVWADAAPASQVDANSLAVPAATEAGTQAATEAQTEADEVPLGPMSADEWLAITGPDAAGDGAAT